MVAYCGTLSTLNLGLASYIVIPTKEGNLDAHLVVRLSDFGVFLPDVHNDTWGKLGVDMILGKPDTKGLSKFKLPEPLAKLFFGLYENKTRAMEIADREGDERVATVAFK